MTIGILLGLGVPASRAGERGGRESADGKADAFGELVGKSDRKKPGLEKIGLAGEPRGERLGAGRGFISLYDMGLRRLADEDAAPAPDMPIEDAATQNVEMGGQDDAPSASTDAAADIEPVASSIAAPEQTGMTVYATGDGRRQDPLAPDAGLEAEAGEAAPATARSPVATSSSDAASPVDAEDAADQTRTVQPAQPGGAAERAHRTGRTADQPSSTTQQSAAAPKADAVSAPVPDDPTEAPGAPAASVSSPVDGGTRDAPDQPARQSKPGTGLSGPAANARADDTPADPFAGRVKVLASSAPASPPPPALASLLGTTSASVVAAIEADPAWRAAAAELASAATARNSNSGSGVNSLRIQLHPVELGMVTARLTATGSQLSIEIQVESNDARQRLSSDADAIVKALRSVGLDVDRITIQQSSTAATGTGQSGAGARDQQMAGQQMQGEANGRDRGDRQAGNQQGDEARGTVAERAGNRAGGDLYI